MFTLPSTSDFIAAFPAFSETSTVLLDLAASHAAGFVDDSWCSQSDFTSGFLFKMGEYLADLGEGVSSGAAVGDFKKFKSGEVSYERFTADELSDGGTTSGLPDFAKLYADLLRRNRGGPFTTAFY